VALLIVSGCKKNKFTTEPQISFKAITPNAYSNSTADANLPILTLKVTDAEGDIGFNAGKDTAFIYLTNLRTNRFDSITLPDIKPIAINNFDAEVSVNLKQFLGVPNNSKKDTIYFNVYLKDFAKHKSNVLKTETPVYYFP
jgi:hypothetical protein